MTLFMSQMFRRMFRSMAVEAEALVFRGQRVSEDQLVPLDPRVIRDQRVTMEIVGLVAPRAFPVLLDSEASKVLRVLLEKTERTASSVLRVLPVLLDQKVLLDRLERLVLLENVDL